MTKPLVDESAVYRILVAGRLDARWSDRLADVHLVTLEEPHRIATTELTGRVTDQAALMGVLEQLYSLGLALLRVERLDGDDGAASHPPTGGN